MKVKELIEELQKYDDNYEYDTSKSLYCLLL